MTVEIGAGLSLADVVAVADGAPVAFPELARASVGGRSRAWWNVRSRPAT